MASKRKRSVGFFHIHVDVKARAISRYCQEGESEFKGFTFSRRIKGIVCVCACVDNLFFSFAWLYLERLNSKMHNISNIIYIEN